MYARVPKAMAQFVLKIEKLCHIMGPTPILEMARAFGLRQVRVYLSHFSDFSLGHAFRPEARDPKRITEA